VWSLGIMIICLPRRLVRRRTVARLGHGGTTHGTTTTHDARALVEPSATSVGVSANAVHLLSLDLPVDQPEGVDMARNVPEACQEDVDEKVTTATCDHECRQRRENDGNDDEENV